MLAVTRLPSTGTGPLLPPMFSARMSPPAAVLAARTAAAAWAMFLTLRDSCARRARYWLEGVRTAGATFAASPAAPDAPATDFRSDAAPGDCALLGASPRDAPDDALLSEPAPQAAAPTSRLAPMASAPRTLRADPVGLPPEMPREMCREMLLDMSETPLRPCCPAGSLSEWDGARRTRRSHLAVSIRSRS